MKKILIGAAVAAMSLTAFAVPEASARFFDPALQGPDLVEQAQCVVRRERVVRPNGAVVYRTARRCGGMDRGFGRGMGGGMGGCRVVRERIERPNGNTVIRTRRVCR